MYAPDHFRERDPQRMIRLMTENSFAVVTSVIGGRLHATHIPLLMADRDEGDSLPRLLLGHFAAGNAHGAPEAEGAPTIAIFSAADAYITPRWYRDEPDVPTWNYGAVHVHGHLRHINDWGEVRALLQRTVDRYEATSDRPWTLSDIPAATVDGYQKGVTAFAIVVDNITAISKYSQDKSHADRASVASGLHGRGEMDDARVGAEMESS